MPSVYSPVQVDPSFGNSAVESNSIATTAGPIVIANRLYMALNQTIANGASSNSIAMFRSVNGGITWTELDAAHKPSGYGTWAYNQALNAMQIAAVPLPGAVAGQSIFLQDFNFATGLWGAPYGLVSQPLGKFAFRLVVRPDNSLIVFSDKASGKQLFAAVYAAGAWAAQFEVSVNAAAIWPTDVVTATVDSSGLTHVWFDIGFVFNGRSTYQQINPDNSLGNFHNFPDPGFPDGWTFESSQPAIVGNNWVLPLTVQSGLAPSTNFQTLLVGTPLTNPVFTLMTFPGFDAPWANANHLAAGRAPVLYFDGITIYAVSNDSDAAAGGVSAQNLLRVSQAVYNGIDPSVGWTGGTSAFQVIDGPLSFSSIPGQEFERPTLYDLNGQVMLSVEAQATALNRAQFWLGNFTPQNFQGAGGNPAAKFRCCTDGHDVQLALAARKLERQHANKAAYPYVWLEPPEDAIPVNAIADIPSPAPNAQTVVLAYQVPSGFRFWLHGALMDYQGGALNPGDALWTADQNDSQVNVQGSGVQGLIGIPFPLGSVPHGRWWRFYMPFSFEPLTVIRSKVLNVNLGGGVFTSGFLGYLVPVS